MQDLILLFCAVVGSGIILIVVALNIFVCVKDYFDKNVNDDDILTGIHINPI